MQRAGALTWPDTSVVTAQEPSAGSLVARWDTVQVRFRRADGDQAGDRAPRLPSPSPDGLQAYAAREDGR